MSKFIGINDICILSVNEIVKSVYKKDKKNKLTKLEKTISTMKNLKFKDFSKQLKNVSFNSNNIYTHEINLDNLIIPDRYLSAGANGITFLAKLRKKEKKNVENVIVKYEVVRDRDYEECQDKYIKCIDSQKNKVNFCKVNEIYCRLESAFDEIYINKNHIQYLNCPNFAMFYAFFMCPTYSVIFEEDKKTPSQAFIEKYINNKNFCLLNSDNSLLDSERMHVFSVYEYIKGQTLYDYILSFSFNIKTFYEILLQIFGALSIAQVPNSIYYNHNDLHCKNVMIETHPKNGLYNYVYNFPFEKTVNRIESNKRAVIIDQGSASLLVKKRNSKKYKAVFGWYKKKISKVIGNFNSPYADVYRIITYSYYLMTRRYKPDLQKIKNHINRLFSLENTKFSTICTDFIDNEHEVWFDNYIIYLKENLSLENFSILMKKIEKITYEYAYNFFYYNFDF